MSINNSAWNSYNCQPLRSQNRSIIKFKSSNVPKEQDNIAEKYDLACRLLAIERQKNAQLEAEKGSRLNYQA